MKKLALLWALPLICGAMNYMNHPVLSQLPAWPKNRPEVPEDHQTMFGNHNRLGNAIVDVCRTIHATAEDPIILVELGCWLGVSTRFMCDKALSITPHVVVIGIDHWLGSIEINNDVRFIAKLPTLYDTFLTNCWNHQLHLIPLRMTTLEGLDLLYKMGIQPHLFYLDASHDYESVKKELKYIHTHFPHAKITGDDYDWDQAPGWNYPVRRAVHDFATKYGYTVFGEKKFWALTKK